MLEKMACAASRRLLDSPVLRPRSTQCLPPCYRKRSEPSRARYLLPAAKTQNSDVWTTQLNRRPSVPLCQEYVQDDRESSPRAGLRLIHEHHSVLLRGRSLGRLPLGKGQPLQDATRTGLRLSDK